MTAQTDFQALAPDIPLPWYEDPDRPGVILDADGIIVCEVNNLDEGWRGIAAMIVVAVNTCGSFIAELDQGAAQ